MNQTSVDDVINWLRNINYAKANGKLLPPNFIKPYHLVMAAIALNDINFDFIGDNDKQKYIARMKFWKAINRPCNIVLNHNDEDGKFLPIFEIFNEPDMSKCSKKLSDIIDNNSISNIKDGIYVILNELLDNCFSHGCKYFTDRILVAAQPWPKGNMGQLVIIDSGIGIRASLEENDKFKEILQDENACNYATTHGITSKSSGHAGMGLFVTERLIHFNEGNLIILSGSEIVRYYEGKQTDIRRIDNSWKGTIIIIEWNSKKPLTTKPVYDLLPKTEGLIEDDFTS